MEKLDKKLLLCFAITTAAGAALHFLFTLWPSILTEFVAPVNESLWEHVKLVFWPFLLAGVWAEQTGRWGRDAWLFTLLFSCGLLLLGGWLIHVTAGPEAMALHISLYLVVMGIAFFLPVLLPGGDRWSGVLTVAVILLAGLIVCWTIQPPDAALFYDLSLADTFSKLPC